MDTNTIIILTAVLTFIFVFGVFFILLIQRGAKNAKKGYVFRHRFSGSHPYMNQTEMHYHVCDLIDHALKDKQAIEGIEIRLITRPNENTGANCQGAEQSENGTPKRNTQKTCKEYLRLCWDFLRRIFSKKD